MFIETPGLADNGQEQISGDTLGDIVELAQAAKPGGETIGQISTVQGTVFITHTDGSKTQASDGVAIFQGDLIETGDSGAVGITFADESTFSLADNGSMVIDEMVYDPATKTGNSALSVAEGVFTFVSGEIAKTGVDAMTISTPVAVIGIRGTDGGGRAGPEGFKNTFSLFAGADGVIGEMTITTQGGSQIMSTPNQTTQISSRFVPPSLPVTLPAAAVARFYAKAAAVAPTPIITQPTSATGQSGDAGPAGQTGGPTDAGPTGDALSPEAAAEQAAQQAFEQALAQGGSLEDAMAAAVDGATEAGLQAVLAVNPNQFGTTGAAVMDNIINSVLLKVTGGIDPLSAGTGAGPGFSQFSNTVFFETALAIIESDLGKITGNVFGETFGPALGGQEGDFFASFFDDPFADFQGDFSSDINLFAGDDLFFLGAGDLFFLDAGDITIFGTDDLTFIGPVETTTFDEILDGTTGDDTLVGTADNTNFFMGFNASGGISHLGGADTVDGGGGINQLTFDDLDDLQFTMTTDTSILDKGSIAVTTLAGATPSFGATTITYTDVQQFLFADGVQNLGVDFNSGGATLDTSGAPTADSGDTIVFPSLDPTEVGKAFVGTSAGETITVSGAIDGALVFGKGGGDTIAVNGAIDGLFIGGITATDNRDTNSDQIADADINVFTYAGLTLPGGATGLEVILLGVDFANGTANFGGDGLVQDNATTPTFNNNLWDVGSFIGSTGNDQILVNGGASGGGFALIDGGNGDDTFVLSNAARIGTVSGGAGTNAYNITGASTVATLTGGAGADTIRFGIDAIGNPVATGGTVGNVTLVETIQGGTGNDSVTLGAGGQTVSVSGTIETFTGGSGADVLNFTSSGVTLGNVQLIETINGNTGTDSVTLGAGGQTVTISAVETINGGAGNDSVTTSALSAGGAAADIAGKTFDGGGGTDTLTLTATSAATLSAANLASVTGFETWTLASNATYNLTLNTANAGTGTLTIDATAINVNGSFGTFDASAVTGGSINLSVTTSALDTGTATLTGGAGTSDVLSFQSSIVLDATELANISGFETWTIATDGVYNLTLADGNNAATLLTINGAAATTSALVINGAADTNGTLSITGGGVGDTLTGGAGADTLTGGAGADTLTGNGAADTFAYNATGDFGDTITDFIAATDKAQFDISSFLADTNSLLTTGDATATSTDTAGGAAVSFQTVAATGDFTTTAGNEIFILSNAAFNSAANIQTAIQTGGGTVISFSNSVDSGVFLIAYDTGTVARIAAVTISNDFTTSGATVTDVAELTGITDVTTLTTADFSFIA